MRERRSGAPGECVDCGNDAYIRLAGGNGEITMVCAHCFAERARSLAPSEAQERPPASEQPQARR